MSENLNLTTIIPTRTKYKDPVWDKIYNPKLVAGYRFTNSTSPEESLELAKIAINEQEAGFLDDAFPNWRKSLTVFNGGVAPTHVYDLLSLRQNRDHVELSYMSQGTEHYAFLKKSHTARIEFMGTQLQGIAGVNSYRHIPFEGSIWSSPHLGDVHTGRFHKKYEGLPIVSYKVHTYSDYAVCEYLEGTNGSMEAFGPRADLEDDFMFQLGQIRAFEDVFGEAERGTNQMVYNSETNKLTRIDLEGLFRTYSLTYRLESFIQYMRGLQPSHLDAYYSGARQVTERVGNKFQEVSDLILYFQSYGFTGGFGELPVNIPELVEKQIVKLDVELKGKGY